MSNPAIFVLKKTSASDVYTFVSPMSNPTVRREIYLTNRVPSVNLPVDWALGFLMDSGNFELYKNGFVTFSDNEALIKMAIENGVWFGDIDDFKPASENEPEIIFGIIKAGNRSKIQNAVQTYGAEKIIDVASARASELTVAVVNMLEQMLKVQLTIDE